MDPETLGEKQLLLLLVGRERYLNCAGLLQVREDGSLYNQVLYEQLDIWVEVTENE